jgi:SprT protein
MDALKVFLPAASLQKINDWINELDVQLNIANPRKTKLGDFKVVKNTLFISINNDLNPYSFLITLTHELAHAFVYVKYKTGVLPHGNQWQKTFKSMMLNFLNPAIFPDDVLKVLSVHLKHPKASTCTDVNLGTILKKYDHKKSLPFRILRMGVFFQLQMGRYLKKESN